MNVLIIGNGGREHAIVQAIAKSPKVNKIYAMKGNAGIGELAELMPAVGEEIFEPIKEDSYVQLSDKHLSSAYAEGISADLRSSFGLSDFSVGVVLDGEGKPQRVAVTLFGKDIFKNPYAIEERISKAFSCECTVTVG